MLETTSARTGPDGSVWNDGPRGRSLSELIGPAHTADCRVRFGCRRADGAARAARAAAARGLRLPRRHGALPVRRANARGACAVLRGDRRGAVAPAHEATRRRVQLGDCRGAAEPAPADARD